MISIIVPIYKVEQYIRSCIESLICQTYENLEIILVDDGSPDNSGQICDEYAKKDSRIKVIHKENGGLSDARNVGLSLAKGEYIGFVDSDDRIHPEMYEELMKSMEKYHSDISMCGYYKEFEDGMLLPFIFKEMEIEKREAMIKLLEDVEIRNFVWNKLYKRQVLENIQFPEREEFEDILTLYKIFLKAQKVSNVEKALYYYRIRENSITASGKKVHSDSMVKAFEKQREGITALYPELDGYCIQQLFWSYRMLCMGILEDKNRTKEEEELYQKSRNRLKELEKQAKEALHMQKSAIFNNAFFCRMPKFYLWLYHLKSKQRE